MGQRCRSKSKMLCVSLLWEEQRSGRRMPARTHCGCSVKAEGPIPYQPGATPQDKGGRSCSEGRRPGLSVSPRHTAHRTLCHFAADKIDTLPESCMHDGALPDYQYMKEGLLNRHVLRKKRHSRAAMRNQPVARLSLEPFRRCCLQFFDEASNGNRPAKTNRDVSVVGGASSTVTLAAGVTGHCGEVGVKGGSNCRINDGQAILGAEDYVDNDRR